MSELSWRRAAAVALKDARHARADPAPLIVLTLMPLLIMSFVNGAFGATQSVPGIASMFSFFLVGYVGQTVFREHGWRTWNRLRAGPLRPAELLTGRLAALLTLALTQLAVLFTAGGLLFGLHVRGPVVALAAVAAALALCMVCYGFALVALCRSIMQLNALANLTALLFAGCGGALVPYATLPGWAQAAGVVTPTYWAMRGFDRVIVAGDGLGGVLLPIAVLCGLAAVCAGVAVLFFRFDQVKVPWT